MLTLMAGVPIHTVAAMPVWLVWTGFEMPSAGLAVVGALGVSVPLLATCQRLLLRQ